MTIKRTVKRAAKTAFNAMLNACDRAGFQVIPKNYYSPMPDHAWLASHKSLWTGRLRMNGIAWDLDCQLAWVREISASYSEVRSLNVYEQRAAAGWGPGYGPIESQVLHCFLRWMVPQRIVEIGSGVSTACMCHARYLNGQEHTADITSIEPYPAPAFARLPNVRHIKLPCQAVNPGVFEDLRSGDLLFIDSSHAVKTGSDVIRIYLDIIPSLAAGVYIHIHDVYLPYAYPRDAMTHFFHWQETALLTALLTNNKRLKILACLSALHYDRSEQLAEILTDYRPQANEQGLDAAGGPVEGRHFPSSLWMITQ